VIAQSLLNELAEHVDGRIAKVVINGSYDITSFKVRELNDNVVALNYIVPVADVSLITSIELRDSSDYLITSNSVNIPIAADHLMLQTIIVKEGN
jgi:hypothetical protein